MSLINYFTLFLFFLILINIKAEGADTAPVMGEDFPGIVCGEASPTKKEDCNNFHTDEYLCCWISYSQTYEKSECTFLSREMANEKGIGTEKLFKEGRIKYWYCNFYFYKINYILIFIFFILLLF